MENLFTKLSAINVNEHTEKKNGLTYLSWSWAWAEFKKVCPDATYKILPVIENDNLGYMVQTEVTAEGITHGMWLPVMDSGNNAMKKEPYTVKTRYKDITVNAATMFDVNKAYMRCLVKNLAMFGLGIYIYAGEDLPEPSEPMVIKKSEAKEEKKEAPAKATKDEMLTFIGELVTRYNLSMDYECKQRKLDPNKLTEAGIKQLYKELIRYGVEWECRRINRGIPRMMEYYGLTDNSPVEDWRIVIDKLHNLR